MTKNGGIAAFESPDRQYLYYTEQRGDTISESATSGRSGEQGCRFAVLFNFAPVEEGTYYLREDGDGGQAAIALLSARDRVPRTIARIESGSGLTSIELSPDRGSLVYAQYDSGGPT